jgi:hypothetical protein
MSDYQFHALLSVVCYIAFKQDGNSAFFWAGLLAALIAFVSTELFQAFLDGLTGRKK